MALILSSLKLAAGLVLLAAASALQALILLVLLPSRTARIRSCIVFARLVGVPCMWLSGCRLTVKGREHLNPSRPAIYVVNHTSLIDMFIALKLVPRGTVGLFKREVMFYPFIGQVILLSGHPRLDRSRHSSAVASMRSLGDLVKRARLSIFMSPEGTRSRNGRLQPFKKGLVHLALQTGLPVVPVVIHGAHRAWVKGSLSVRGVPILVEVLPAASTSGWSAERLDDALEEVHALFRLHLPPEQQPAG
jgi:lysophosphatidate acyltransferase